MLVHVFVQCTHALVIADMDRKKIRIVVRNTCTKRREISFLKDVIIKKCAKFVETFQGWGLRGM